jgi:hypothetical protein
MAGPMSIGFNSLNRNQKIQLVKDWLDGKRIYVQYGERCEMREGAIAYISRWDAVKDALTKNGSPMNRYTRRQPHWVSRSSSSSKPVTYMVGTDEYLIDPDAVSAHWFFVKWDGRKNEVQASAYEVDYLLSYSGECVWQWGRKDKPKVIPLDRLGREIKVGDFACYILHHFGTNRGASTQFGTVQKIQNDGTVWAKNVALSDGELSKLKRINDNKTVVILTKDLMDRLMMAKLSTL